MHTHIYIDLKDNTLELCQFNLNGIQITQNITIEDYIDIFVGNECIFKAEQKPNEPKKHPIRTSIQKTDKKVQRKTNIRKNTTTRKSKPTTTTK